VPHGVDLVGRHVQAVVALVLEQQVVALDPADGALDHAAVAGHAVLVVDDVVADLEVVEEALRVAAPGASAPVRPAPAGEVGLGEDGQPHGVGPQHRPAFQRRHDHLGRPALRRQPLPQALGGAVAVGTDHDAESVAPQAHEPPDQGGAVAHHRVPGRGQHLRRVGAVGDAHHVPCRRPGVGEQAVEVEVQPGEAVIVCLLHASPRPRQARSDGAGAAAPVAVAHRAPRHRERCGEVGLLRQQVGGAVAHSPWLAEQHLRAIAHDVEQHVLAPGEPRQPRLHAVEHQALGQPFPLLAPPRLEPDQPLGPLPYLGRGQQLATGEDLDERQVGERALVGNRELGEPVDLVAPEVDPHRAVGRGGEHVDDGPPHRDLTPVLHHVLAAVPGEHQLRHELVAVELLPGPHDHRLDVLDVGTQPLHERPHRGDDHAGRPLGVSQTPQHPCPPAHGLDGGADALERQRLPRREQLDRFVAQVGGQVVGQALGLGGRRYRQHDRAAAREPCQPGGDDRPRRLGHRQSRRGAPEHLCQGRLVTEQARQVVEGRVRTRPCVRRGGGHGDSKLPAGCDESVPGAPPLRTSRGLASPACAGSRDDGA
jgi:hypothetical protein